MFDPDFMRCLQNFGARRGMGLEFDRDKQTIPAFWELSTIDLPSRASPPQAANDN
jgi:hypothetical protein